MARTYRVACLTGSGTAPELMAEASRAMHAVARPYGFRLELDYVPFGADALVRGGLAVPRGSYLDADAVLVADADDDAVEELRAELDLRSRQTRVRFGDRSDLVLLAPLSASSAAWTVSQAFALARSRRGRLAAIADGPAWQEVVRTEIEANEGVQVDVLERSAALAAAAFDAESFDVLVADPTLGELLASLLCPPAAGRAGTWLSARSVEPTRVGAASIPARVAASAFLAGHGPSLFAPLDTGSVANAGFGVTDPSSMLLAAAMLLGDGLGERAAAETLVGALAGTTVRTPNRIRRGVAATTREVTDAVVAGFQNAFANAEFHPGVL